MFSSFKNLYYICIVKLIKLNVMNSKFIKVYFNRITMWVYLGAFFIFMMCFCNPYINVFLFLCGLFSIMFGCTHVIEDKVLTSGERLFINKIDKLF